MEHVSAMARLRRSIHISGVVDSTEASMTPPKRLTRKRINKTVLLVSEHLVSEAYAVVSSINAAGYHSYWDSRDTSANPPPKTCKVYLAITDALSQANKALADNVLASGCTQAATDRLVGGAVLGYGKKRVADITSAIANSELYRQYPAHLSIAVCVALATDGMEYRKQSYVADREVSTMVVANANVSVTLKIHKNLATTKHHEYIPLAFHTVLSKLAAQRTSTTGMGLMASEVASLVSTWQNAPSCLFEQMQYQLEDLAAHLRTPDEDGNKKSLFDLPHHSTLTDAGSILSAVTYAWILASTLDLALEVEGGYGVKGCAADDPTQGVDYRSMLPVASIGRYGGGYKTPSDSWKTAAIEMLLHPICQIVEEVTDAAINTDIEGIADSTYQLNRKMAYSIITHHTNHPPYKATSGSDLRYRLDLYNRPSYGHNRSMETSRYESVMAELRAEYGVDFRIDFSREYHHLTGVLQQGSHNANGVLLGYVNRTRTIKAVLHSVGTQQIYVLDRQWEPPSMSAGNDAHIPADLMTQITSRALRVEVDLSIVSSMGMSAYTATTLTRGHTIDTPNITVRHLTRAAPAVAMPALAVALHTVFSRTPSLALGTSPLRVHVSVVASAIDTQCNHLDAHRTLTCRALIDIEG